MNVSGPAGASREHDTRQLHAMAPRSWARPSNGPEAASRMRLALLRPRPYPRHVEHRPVSPAVRPRGRGLPGHDEVAAATHSR